MTEIVTSYQLGIKREVINALRSVFTTTYPDPQFVDAANNKSRVYIGTDFPLHEVQYPAIFVTYSEGLVHNAGIGNFDLQLQDDGSTRKILHWNFQGEINFHIFARTTMDREMLSAGLLNIFAFGQDTPEFANFWKEIYDADWVALAFIGDNPMPGGDSEEIAPWNAEERVYVRSYRVSTMGDFYTNPLSGGLIKISDIDMFPYRYDQPVPQGNQNPPNNTVAWQP